MIDTGVTIKLYELSELSPKAKQKAIDAHRGFLLSTMQPDDFISGDPEYDTQEELQKAYGTEYNYYVMNDEPIIESIEANEYCFFEDGEMAQVVKYCGGHPLAGQTHFTLYGQDYNITEAAL